ncbi:hypothetical protein AGMMS49983_18880 [Clostridia bacterium]|nr:hypothetical protein AGMMS49983_18770 [Clostridia bacterium]GHU67539.1 hypothetical protein AGMMS49983_18880 [Clostridia bacterium]
MKGANADLLFLELSAGKPPKWNFTKFLIDREGNLSERFASAVKPEQLVPWIEDLLN